MKWGDFASNPGVAVLKWFGKKAAKVAIDAATQKPKTESTKSQIFYGDVNTVTQNNN